MGQAWLSAARVTTGVRPQLMLGVNQGPALLLARRRGVPQNASVHAFGSTVHQGVGSWTGDRLMAPLRSRRIVRSARGGLPSSGEPTGRGGVDMTQTTIDPAQAAAYQFGGQDIPWLIDHWAEHRAEHAFLIWEPKDGSERTWTYAEFAEATKRVAAGLVARGVGLGGKVLIHAENCPEAVIAWYACRRARCGGSDHEHPQRGRRGRVLHRPHGLRRGDHAAEVSRRWSPRPARTWGGSSSPTTTPASPPSRASSTTVVDPFSSLEGDAATPAARRRSRCCPPGSCSPPARPPSRRPSCTPMPTRCGRRR